ncbi:Unknown protein sequence [Pseudomonas syringae pv. syringae]|nr:Unknown protein sequence [Pseudomonas syringae pv. syringae]
MYPLSHPAFVVRLFIPPFIAFRDLIRGVDKILENPSQVHK